MTRIDKQAVKRLSRTMSWYGNHWKVGDVFSEQRAADCDRVADTLLTLLAALDAAEAEKRKRRWRLRMRGRRDARDTSLNHVEKVRAEAYREALAVCAPSIRSDRSLSLKVRDYSRRHQTGDQRWVT
jgi:hypothetical protein